MEIKIGYAGKLLYFLGEIFDPGFKFCTYLHRIL